MKLIYTAFDKAGKSVTDSVEARDIGEATDILRRQGFYVTQMKQVGPDAAGGPGGSIKTTLANRLNGNRRLRNLAVFTRQLHVLMSTGTPMVEALTALERQSKDVQWRSVIVALRGKVEEGASLSSAMSSFPQEFDPVCRSLVGAGESGGDLDVMLDRVATIAKRQMHTRNAIVGALVYPTLLIVVALAVLAVLLLFVLPRFALLFKSLDTPLPPTTKFLMGMSDLLRAYWWLVPPVVFGAVVGGRAWLATSMGKRSVDTVMLKIPRLGDMTRNFITARLVRLLGVLIQGKVPLIDALNLVRESTVNHHYTQLMVRAVDAVTRGESLAGAFADNTLVTTSVHEAMRSGERSGQLGPLLNTMADFLDEENEVTLRSLTSILEPMILIILGIFVGFVALSMFMPLFDLTAATRG